MFHSLNNYDVLYDAITTRIIRKYDPNDVKFMPPKYNNPHTQTFTITLPTDSSQSLSKKIEESKIWQDIIGHVSPEIFAARIILYSHAKYPVPLFCSKNTFRIQRIVKELENKYSSTKIREELINHYCKFKQTYWAFTKLARIWKIRWTPIRIQTDLYMN
jgi:hypothetical protein